jgi:hypothetical protein
MTQTSCGGLRLTALRGFDVFSFALAAVVRLLAPFRFASGSAAVAGLFAASATGCDGCDDAALTCDAEKKHGSATATAVTRPIRHDGRRYGGGRAAGAIVDTRRRRDEHEAPAFQGVRSGEPRALRRHGTGYDSGTSASATLCVAGCDFTYEVRRSQGCDQRPVRSGLRRGPCAAGPPATGACLSIEQTEVQPRRADAPAWLKSFRWRPLHHQRVLHRTPLHSQIRSPQRRHTGICISDRRFRRLPAATRI